MTTFRKEADVKAAVKKELARYQAVWYFMPASNGYGRAGIPDFICNFQNRFLAIETKFLYGKPTPAQKMELKKIDDSAGIAVIINEKNIETLSEILDALNFGLYDRARCLAKETLSQYGIEA